MLDTNYYLQKKTKRSRDIHKCAIKKVRITMEIEANNCICNFVTKKGIEWAVLKVFL